MNTVVADSAPATSPATELDFTGERYIPGVAGDIALEHHHRYALCLEAVRGKDVLDIACGEGYGCALMGQVAKSVLGVDIDPATVAHAERRYGTEDSRLRFRTGSCDAIPAPDQSVDVLTSFETIEHHDKHEEMMQEVRRVLRPGGLLIISSPNRRGYSDEPGYENPFHVRELYREEFLELLRRYFPCVALYSQKISNGSFILPASTAEVAGEGFRWFGGKDATAIETTPRPFTGEPAYFIAVCADTPDLLTTAGTLASVYMEADQEMAHWSEAVNAQMREIHAQSVAREQEATRAWNAVTEMTALRDAANVEAHQLRETLNRIRASRFWKLRRRARRLLGLPENDL